MACRPRTLAPRPPPPPLTLCTRSQALLHPPGPRIARHRASGAPRTALPRRRHPLPRAGAQASCPPDGDMRTPRSPQGAGRGAAMWALLPLLALATLPASAGATPRTPAPSEGAWPWTSTQPPAVGPAVTGGGCRLSRAPPRSCSCWTACSPDGGGLVPLIVPEGGVGMGEGLRTLALARAHARRPPPLRARRPPDNQQQQQQSPAAQFAAARWAPARWCLPAVGRAAAAAPAAPGRPLTLCSPAPADPSPSPPPPPPPPPTCLAGGEAAHRGAASLAACSGWHTSRQRTPAPSMPPRSPARMHAQARSWTATRPARPARWACTAPTATARTPASSSPQVRRGRGRARPSASSPPRRVVSRCKSMRAHALACLPPPRALPRTPLPRAGFRAVLIAGRKVVITRCAVGTFSTALANGTRVPTANLTGLDGQALIDAVAASDATCQNCAANLYAPLRGAGLVWGGAGAGARAC